MPIRQLSSQDAETFRELRLEGLRVAPAAFAVATEDVAHQPLAWFGAALGLSAVFAAEDGAGRLLGMLAYQDDPLHKRRHIGHLWGMYVRAEASGHGLGTALMVAAISHARSRVAVLQLAVGAANPTAIRLYERAGFRLYGTELASLRVNGVDATTLLMALHFD